MSRDVAYGALIKRSGHLRILSMALLFFLFFWGSITMAYADDHYRGSRGYGGHERYYYEGNGIQPGEMGERGNGATGTLATFLLILANLTVFLSLILKGINRLFPFSQDTKNSITVFNRSQKKYLRWLHYYVNPVAICIAFLHFHLSSCRSMLPDAALIMFIVIGVLGVMLKFQMLPKNMYKTVYSTHCSWIAFFCAFLLLTIGHATV